MTNHLPLNGERVINAVHAALGGQTASQPDNDPAPQYRLSAADAARYALEGIELPDDAPDGTGAATKSETPTRLRATDPSQGRGPAPRPAGNQDPLVNALSRLTGARRRW